jgi:hypothetical protein
MQAREIRYGNGEERLVDALILGATYPRSMEELSLKTAE